MQERVVRLRADTYALYFACRDPRVPWYAKALVGLVAFYAVSPLDLIPDFIPVLGALDELVLVPLGIGAAVRMIPKPVWEECRARAKATVVRPGRRRWIAGAAVVAVWALVLGLTVLLVVTLRRHRNAVLRPH